MPDNSPMGLIVFGGSCPIIGTGMIAHRGNHPEG